MEAVLGLVSNAGWSDNAKNLKDALLASVQWGVQGVVRDETLEQCRAQRARKGSHPTHSRPHTFGTTAQVAADSATPPATLVVMNDSIHLAQYVRKADSQLIGAFTSHPGPLGQLRAGRPHLYYQPPPPSGPAWLPDEAFQLLPAAALNPQRVAVWTLTASAFLPEALLAELEGLVLAGSGTGSLSAALVERLAPAWTSKLPIVIVSRCV